MHSPKRSALDRASWDPTHLPQTVREEHQNQALPISDLWQVALPITPQALLLANADQGRDESLLCSPLQGACLQATSCLQQELDSIKRSSDGLACTDTPSHSRVKNVHHNRVLFRGFMSIRRPLFF